MSSVHVFQSSPLWKALKQVEHIAVRANREGQAGLRDYQRVRGVGPRQGPGVGRGALQGALDRRPHGPMAPVARRSHVGRHPTAVVRRRADRRGRVGPVYHGRVDEGSGGGPGQGGDHLGRLHGGEMREAARGAELRRRRQQRATGRQ